MYISKSLISSIYSNATYPILAIENYYKKEFCDAWFFSLDLSL